MRTITAPGVEWREIDKSQYSPAMTGTACYVMGFTDKGEPYKPMEFTSRVAFTNYYGEPDNEAERYAYAAACEVLNQNGRLWFARLPYDNDAFEKMVGIRYDVTLPETQAVSVPGLSAIHSADEEINEYAQIECMRAPMLYDLSAIDEYRTEESKVPAGSFLIVDTTGATYGKVQEDTRKGVRREAIGIVPVVTTAANAIYAQQLISASIDDVQAFETLGGDKLKSLVVLDADGNYDESLSSDGLLAADLDKLLNTNNYYQMISSETFVYNWTNFYDVSASIDEVKADAIAFCDAHSISGYSDVISIVPISDDPTEPVLISSAVGPADVLPEGLEPENAVKWTFASNVTVGIDPADPRYGMHNPDGDDAVPDTFALDANNWFSTIQPAEDGSGFDPEHLKDVGVVVYRLYLDPSVGNKVSYEPVEAYCGSLYKDAKDPNTGVTKFLDTIINSQSKYINFFSNCFNDKASKQKYNEKIDILYVKPNEGATLGLYSPMTAEDISISKSIYDGINKSFDKVADINQLDIDIVLDGGLSNIASYLKAIYGNKGKYDLMVTDDLGNSLLGLWKAADASNAAVKTWKTVVQKLDTFCKKTRKDCMTIADGLRPLVLQGQKKIVRDSKPSNTIDANILPYLKTVTGLNSSYISLYIDWFEVADDYSGDFFWCPPSIKAMGCYINTDVNFNYWDAPAGFQRGVVAAADVAFSPTPKQAGAMYEKSLNYAINYPQDGIILEGQKTTQSIPSAFDRVNVRRLFLRLERMSYKTARYFVYEGNTTYTRQRLVDALDPYFKEAKVGGGIYDYRIICDETINTPDVIDRNELHVKIAIKPTKTIEFIMLDFIAMRTGGSFEEVL